MKRAVAVLLSLFAVIVLGAEKIPVAAGLPPVGWIAAQIGGAGVVSSTVLAEGKTPHDYSPKPQTLRQLNQNRIFFSTGMPFEKRIENALKKNVSIVNIGEKIERRTLEMEDEHEQHGKHGHHHHHHDDEKDPHIWLSPANAVKIAETIADALIRQDPAGAALYRRNLEAFRAKMTELDAKIRKELAPYAGRAFFVYHPSFGYFADAYKLHQHGIEMSGREATGAQIAKVLRLAKKEQVSVIFVQPQFNPDSAHAIARRLGGEVAPLDPLAYDLGENFIKITDALQKGFSKGGRR